MPTYDFSAVGFLVLDVLGRYAEDLPPPGGATFIDEITMTVAGTAGATAMDCAILGLNGQIAARIGRDAMGDFLAADMARVGLNLDLLQRDATVQTSCSMLPIRPNGVRSAFFVPGTSATFLPTAAEVDQILDARIIHLGGTGFLDAFDGAPSVELLKRAKALGRNTVFDLIQANAETVAKVLPLLPHIDYFIPSIHEAAAMAGDTDPAAVARWFKARGVKNAILTLEGDGVYVDPADGAPFHLPSHQIDVVDTTGCGDSFTAGIIVGLAKGWPLRDCARFANTVAAHVALGLGSQGRLTAFDDTRAAMDSWPLRELQGELV
ncbi:carbohydrate kinase family protein [Pseudoruegeria sp. SK021]|uniref:carbohydrate kinase family protein n=1 Tax=Pseudoruegeria sp. SK021 TaxID=1933035 RepID=UPI000A23C7A8|nr:sugar kinase [Pseudoruegeria sp. SK021]OSP54800.1 kinase [Pseudoruegeria sp. SK021]